MKQCPICKSLCSDNETKCNICSTVLPSTTALHRNIAGSTQIKRCSCGEENSIHAIRCKSCGRFLSDVQASTKYQNAVTADTFRLSGILSSGEKIEINDELTLGRQYQKELFDVYSHRAAYHIHYDKEARIVLIDDLNKGISKTLQYNTPYEIGRKTIIFKKENS